MAGLGLGSWETATKYSEKTRLATAARPRYNTLVWVSSETR